MHGTLSHELLQFQLSVTRRFESHELCSGCFVRKRCHSRLYYIHHGSFLWSSSCHTYFDKQSTSTKQIVSVTASFLTAPTVTMSAMTDAWGSRWRFTFSHIYLYMTQNDTNYHLTHFFFSKQQFATYLDGWRQHDIQALRANANTCTIHRPHTIGGRLKRSWIGVIYPHPSIYTRVRESFLSMYTPSSGFSNFGMAFCGKRKTFLGEEFRWRSVVCDLVWWGEKKRRILLRLTDWMELDGYAEWIEAKEGRNCVVWQNSVMVYIITYLGVALFVCMDWYLLWCLCTCFGRGLREMGRAMGLV